MVLTPEQQTYSETLSNDLIQPAQQATSSCTETTSTDPAWASAPADLAACSPLTDETACNAVMTAADATVRACTYTPACCSQKTNYQTMPDNQRAWYDANLKNTPICDATRTDNCYVYHGEGDIFLSITNSGLISAQALRENYIKLTVDERKFFGYPPPPDKWFSDDDCSQGDETCSGTVAGRVGEDLFSTYLGGPASVHRTLYCDAAGDDAVGCVDQVWGMNHDQRLIYLTIPTHSQRLEYER